METIHSINSAEELEGFLREYIDPGKFGMGKGLDNLFKEIKKGETTLVLSEAGELLRQIKTACATVTYQDFILTEENPSGVRVELVRRGFSVMEKIEGGEDPTMAMVRGFKEEAGKLKVQPKQIQTSGSEESEPFDSSSYPGLKSQNMLFFFTVQVTEEQFEKNRDGIIHYNSKGEPIKLIWVKNERN